MAILDEDVARVRAETDFVQLASEHVALKKVGNRWTYTSDWDFKPKAAHGRAVVEVVVAAHEKVRVPAGEFDAFRLASTETLSGTSPIGSQYAGEVTRTYWYAPSARAIVKSITRHPYLGPSTVELVDIALQP